MTRRPLVLAQALLAVLILVAGCGGAGIDRRYQAERSLWQAQHEAQRLSIEPKLVTQEQWRNLASRFEAIAARNASVAPGDPATSAGKISAQTRTVSARALISAAQIYAGLGDSLRTMATYQKVQSDYQDLPQATSEVALAQGRIAEARQDWTAAANAYQSVIDRMEPQPGAAGVAGTVLDLPLRVARLRARAAGDSSLAVRAPLYKDALAYYQKQITDKPGSATALLSRIHLAELDNDLGRRDKAILGLTQAEKDLGAMDQPPRDPAEVRYAIGLIQSQTKSGIPDAEKTFQSLVKDYPQSMGAPRALLALAALSDQAGDPDAALGYLDRIRDDYSQAEDLAARAMLVRGQILEKHDRWGEALKVFRALPSEHPVSEAALAAPLEIVAHYKRMNDTTAVAQELGRAEESYREFLDRYPPGPAAVSARQKLVQTLALQDRYGDAVQELVGLGKSLGQSPQGAQVLLQAARLSMTQLADTARTAEILEYTGQEFSNAEVGRWALAEAKRLRNELR